MKDLQATRWMIVKAALLLLIAVISGTLLVLENPSWKVALFLALAVWASCRAYYFAFYVIEHYVDPSFRFSGLIAFLRHFLRRR